jgi:hypothetical protein
LKRVRYIGINAPEVGVPYADQSTQANRSLAEGQDVLLEKDRSETDRYSRLLRYVYLTNGVFVNAEFVSKGLAESIAYPPDTKYQTLLDDLELRAQQQGLGMWVTGGLPSAPATAPTAQVVINKSCSQFNSPGDDNYSKEQEYVCLTNRGSQPVDMTHWWIRDKAGATFTFPAFDLQPGADIRIRTGCGQDGPADLYWCKNGSAVWNDGGDTAYLYDSSDHLEDELT